MIPHIRVTQYSQINKSESGMVVARKRNEELVFNGYRVSVGQDKIKVFWHDVGNGYTIMSATSMLLT